MGDVLAGSLPHSPAAAYVSKSVQQQPLVCMGRHAPARRAVAGRQRGPCRARVSAGDTAPANRAVDESRVIVQQTDGSRLGICRVINGLWQVSSGAWGAGAAAGSGAAVDSMLTHAENGLTTFDMADIYGPAEELYGLFINRVRRERGEEAAQGMQGLTKWCPQPRRMTRAVVQDAVDQSRRRMDVPSIDMLQFHWWEYGDPGYIDALRHLADLKEEGKIRTLALTNFDAVHLQKVLEAGVPIVSNQVQHSLLDQRPQQRLRELCALTGVQFLTYGTVLGGLLSDKFLDQKEPGTWGGPNLATPSQKKYKQVVDAWGGWRLFQDLLRECRQMSRKHGASISSVAVRYVLDQPCVAASMVGVRLGASEHILDSKKALALRLDDEDRARLESVMAKGKDLQEVFGDCGGEYRG